MKISNWYRRDTFSGWTPPRAVVNTVSSRYYSAMSPRPSAYVLLERVANLLRSELRSAGAASDLEPVHLQALDYLDRANDYSNTPLGVAEYLGLTKGNVSQRLIALERSGYLRRTADARDGRVSHLALTAKARALLRAIVPPPHWREALAALPPESVERLEHGLLDLLRALQLAHGARSFGECRTCAHFLADRGRFTCGLTREPLAVEQTTKICREHAAPPGAARLR